MNLPKSIARIPERGPELGTVENLGGRHWKWSLVILSSATNGGAKLGAYSRSILYM
jgi:hypothetical protein